jgi:phosphatidylglycerol:prolipoprotein diacylglycerol transferase
VIRRAPTAAAEQRPVLHRAQTVRFARSAPDAPTARLHVSEFGWRSLADVEPQALGVTYWFEPAMEGEPYQVTLRFTGRRIGAKGRPGPRDRFEVREAIDGVVPGSGPIAVTTRVQNIAAGNWRVTATAVDSPARARRKGGSAARLGKAASSGMTAFQPVVGVLAPGARLGAWSALVAVGALVGVSAQALLASHAGLPVARVVMLSLVACIIGLATAKLYYVAGNLRKRDQRTGLNALTGGMCIQGFVLGAVAVLLLGAPIADLAVAPLLDVTAPALLFGMTIGRLGCLLGGCCAGQPTASRWGVWSSDRRLGMRRIPTQLLESATALLIGLAAAGLVWTTAIQPAGVIFVGAIAAYTLVRQLLFSLRAGPRHTAHGRVITMGLAGLVLAAATAAPAVLGQ